MLYGRVHDAETGQPVADAVVSTGDVFGAVATDSTGAFGIQVYGQPPYYLLTEAIGYEAAEYELPEDATERISVLSLERGPIPIEGIAVVAEARVSGVMRGLANRRGGHSGSVRLYDRDRLDRFAGVNALQLVLQTVPRARECEAVFPLYQVSDRICTQRTNRAPTTFGNNGQVGSGYSASGGFSNTDPSLPPEFQNPLDATTAGGLGGSDGGDLGAGPDELVVCINGWRARSHDLELSAIPIDEIAIYEVFGPPVAPVTQFALAGHVRIYTRIWLLTQASRAVVSFPTMWGC